jgi:hypothetical protein
MLWFISIFLFNGVAKKHTFGLIALCALRSALALRSPSASAIAQFLKTEECNNAAERMHSHALFVAISV